MTMANNILFQAEYAREGKEIKITVNSNFIPMLTYALKLLEFEIENKLIEEQMKKKSTIIKPELDILMRK